MNQFYGHLKTINHHKVLVTKLLFRCGLYKQGILHDLSKYHPVEFLAGVKYYQGYRSPINAEKEVKGYSLGWLHHKGKNKHHWEYWLDNANRKSDDVVHGITAIEMPKEYVVEMVCDRIAASMNYQKEKYTDASALEYFLNGKDSVFMHPNTYKLTKHLLTYLKKNGLDKTILYMRKYVLKNL